MNINKDLKIITKKTNTVFKNNYIELQNNDVIFPNDTLGNHIKIIENNSNTPGIVIICENEQDEILLIELFRYGVESYSLEFPRGYKNKNEPFLDAGLRELKEETNILDRDIIDSTLFGSFFINSAHTASEVGVIYISVQSDNLDIKLEKKESIKNYFWFDTNTLKKRISEGLIKDSFTINALMFYLLKSIK